MAAFTIPRNSKTDALLESLKNDADGLFKTVTCSIREDTLLTRFKTTTANGDAEGDGVFETIW